MEVTYKEKFNRNSDLNFSMKSISMANLFMNLHENSIRNFYISSRNYKSGLALSIGYIAAYGSFQRAFTTKRFASSSTFNKKIQKMRQHHKLLS